MFQQYKWTKLHVVYFVIAPNINPKLTATVKEL